MKTNKKKKKTNRNKRKTNITLLGFVKRICSYLDSTVHKDIIVGCNL